MPSILAWIRRLVRTLRRERLDRDINRELAFHVAERADELRAQGVAADVALREARRRFGNALLETERTRDADVLLWLDAAIRNGRHAIRSARRTPAFSAIVVITLAAGIGANTAVFSAIDAVLLKPLPAPESERLVRVLEFVAAESDRPTQIAPGRLEEWADRATAFEALSGYYVEDVSDTTGALPERIRRAVIAPRFLEVWKIAPARGRNVLDTEHRIGGTPTVLISDRYWRTRFDADPDVLTRVVRIEGETFAIAGVLPSTFPFPDPSVDVWWPYPIDGSALADTPQNRRQRWYTGVGRLRAGVTVEQARADLERVQAHLAREYPETDAGITARVDPLKNAIVGGAGESLWLLYGAASILLLIACTNIASLWLSRAAERRDEVAMRFALGASRAAVAGQLLVEVAVLSSAGAALGLAIAWYAADFSHVLIPNLPRQDEIGVDGRTFAYVTATTVFVTMLCGALPAFRSSRTAESPGGTTRIHTGRSHRVQWMLVGAQMALSVALLVGAGLLVRSADALSRVDPGFDPNRVLAFRVSASWNETGDRAALVARIDRMLGHLEAMPGVEIAATAWSLPGVPRRYQTEFTHVEGQAAPASRIMAEWRSVSPAYFRTLRIPLLQGEPCRVSPGSTAELMINATFVERFFGKRVPIGAHLTWETGSLVGRVVGVVGDARDSGLDREPSPTVYACDSAPTPFPWMLVRTENAPASVARTIRVGLEEIEPTRSVYDLAPLDERIRGAYAQARARTTLLVAFALAALLLAGLGIYATLSYAVSLRRRELALRLALGARRDGLILRIVGQTLRLAAGACGVGLVLSVALRQAVAGMLFGVSASDPLTHALVVLLVLAVAVVAGLIPAIRVTALEPMRVLRQG